MQYGHGCVFTGFFAIPVYNLIIAAPMWCNGVEHSLMIHKVAGSNLGGSASR